MNVNLKFISTGYCTQFAFMATENGGLAKVRFPAISTVLETPNGIMLYDTGYSPAFFDATKQWPYCLYRFITPVVTNDQLMMKNQLLRLGIKPDDVKYIMISHFHADHMCGLSDFPFAKFIFNRLAFNSVSQLNGFKALRKAYLPTLLPIDFQKNSRVLDDLPMKVLPERMRPFIYAKDIFNDGVFWAIDLPGHAQGQWGLYIYPLNTFLVADACWSVEMIRLSLKPSIFCRMLIDNYSQYITTLNNLHELSINNPTLKFIPSHENII